MQLKTLFDIAFKTQFARATIEHWAYGRRPAPAGFPSPIRVGRQLRYIEEEVDAWISSCAASRTGQPVQVDAARVDAAIPARRRPGRPRKAEVALRRAAAERLAGVGHE
jgi:predicted DNA-binding transcriptional regulator AlpA